MTNARETRTKNLHKIEHALFDARNSREKYLAASWYDTRGSYSHELTRTSFSYVCHGLNITHTFNMQACVSVATVKAERTISVLSYLNDRHMRTE